MKSQIRLDMTRDGLRIQIVDEQNRPMFDSGSAVVKPYMRELLREIGHVLSDVPNRITLEGHTDAQPFSGGERGYSNWELSSDRANASRREIVAGGLPEDRMLLVQGLASSNLFVVRAARLLTPPPADGILEGITRGLVLELARADGLDASEESLEADSLRSADEAFLTATLKGILPIRRCDGWPIRHGRPGPITRRLMALFEARVQAETNTGSAPGSTLK